VILALPLLGGLFGGAAARLAMLLPWRLELSRRAALTITLAFVGAFSAVFSAFGVLHYEAVNFHATDVAQIDQRTWATLHGHFMHTTLQGGFENFLAYHFEPILALFSPFYLLIPSPAVLIVAQVVGSGLTAVPLALWAGERLQSGLAAVLVGASFLLNPVIANSNDLLTLHIALEVPFLAWAFYFQLKQRWGRAFLFLALALGVREEISFAVFGMGLYALIAQRQRAGWGMLAVSVGWAALTLGVIIPHFNGGRGMYWANAYGYLGGNTPFEIARSALLHPLVVLQHMAAEPRPYFVASLLVPLGLLPLAGWRMALLAAPTLLYLLMGEGYYNPNSWYPMPALPFLYFAAIEGIRALRRFIPAAVWACYLTAAAALSFYQLGAGPGTRTYAWQAYDVTPQANAAKALAASIPPDLSVSATPQIIAHLSHRMQLSIFPELLIPNDVFVIDFIGWRGWHGYPATYNEYDQALRRVLHDPAYGAFYQGDGLLLLRRGEYPAAPAHAMAAQLGGKIELLGWEAPERVRAGEPLTVRLRWRAIQPPDQQYTVSVQFGNEANGKLAQRDSWPWDGWFPTIEWPAGREIDDPHALKLPASLAPGEYRLFVSVYSLENGQAQPLLTPSGESGVTIGPLSVLP